MKYFTFLSMIVFIFSISSNPLIADVDMVNDNVSLLGKSIEDLLKIEVYSASKHEQTIDEIPASVVIITREEIEKYGYRNYMEIVENVPGFYMNENYYFLGHSNFGVRGFYSDGSFDNVIIMVNGINQIDDSYNSYPDNKINVPVEAIDRIEIIRGPMSVMYGNGAFMGAINIITNSVANSEHSTGKIKADVSTKEIYRGYIRWEGNRGDLNYVINTSVSQNNGPIFQMSDITNDYIFLRNVGSDSNKSSDGQLEGFRQYFNGNLTFNNTEIDFSIINTKKGVFDGMPSLGDGTNLYTNSMNLSFKQNFKINDMYSFYIKSGYFSHINITDYNLKIDNSFSSFSTSEQAYDFEFLNIFNLEENLNFLIGYYRRTIFDLYKQYDYPIYNSKYHNTEGKIKDDENIDNQAIFGQFEYNPVENLSLILGFRAEHVNPYTLLYYSSYGTGEDTIFSAKCLEDKISFVPRVALIYNLFDKHVFKLLYGQATKLPNIGQNFSQLLSDKPALKSADINTYEFNYIFIPKTNILFNFSLFYNRLNDLIVKNNYFNIVDSTWQIYSANKGQMQTIGCEFGIKAEIIENLNFDISLTYQDTKNRDEALKNIEVGYAPKILGYGKISYLLPINEDWDNISFGFVIRFIDDQETEWDNKLQRRIGNKIDSYFVSDINIRFNKLYFKELAGNLRISNIFDKEIRYPTVKGNIWAEKGYLGTGRSIDFSLEYNF